MITKLTVMHYTHLVDMVKGIEGGFSYSILETLAEDEVELYPSALIPWTDTF